MAWILYRSDTVARGKVPGPVPDIGLEFRTIVIAVDLAETSGVCLELSKENSPQ